MKIYQDRILVDEVPDKSRQPGEFFPRLVGINVSSDGKYWEPIYMPLIRWQKGAGQFTLWVNSSKRPLWVITIDHRWPFIQVFKFDWMVIDGS
jgi:hypothetical protein